MAQERQRLAERLRALRQRLGLTQQNMADRLGVHLRSYQQWEYGRRGLRAPTRNLIEREFQKEGFTFEES
jgi:transcriptional regulator with XRE-family HTH domain